MNALDAGKSYRLLPHTADVYIAVDGKGLEEAFEKAAVALFDVMTDVSSVMPFVEDAVEVEAMDEYGLLYSWLEALLVKFDTKEMLYSIFKVESIEQTAGGFRLKAAIWGEKFNARKHVQKVGVKAVTYHRMEIVHQPGNVSVEFILDV